MSDDEKKETREAFRESVNMAPAEIEDWLDTDASKSVGVDAGDGESKGRHSARRIVEIGRKRVDDYTDADYEHMRKVVGYVARHTAQRPSRDVEESDWRYSLMNWGHDPCKGGGCD